VDRALIGQPAPDNHGSSSTAEGVGPRPDLSDQLPGPTRRPPCGRNPLLAAHGVRARAEIVEAARELFTRYGYQATTVESIGEATNRSGAAVYQYFSGKFEIFAIFLREVGTEMLRVAEVFPPLTDDDAGRLELRDWIVQLMDVVEHHAGTFLGWAQVQYTEPELGPLGQDNFQGYQTAVLQRLQAAGVHPPTPGTVPVGILSMVQWTALLNSRRVRPVDRPALADALAWLMHAYLFAPASVAPTPDGGGQRTELPTIPLGEALGLRRPVTPRGAGTVQRILLAAADRFGVNGYRGTSLNDIAARAGVSHGSVYTYWVDREALFSTLARDAVAAIDHQRRALPAGPLTDDSFAGWVDGWVSMLDQHGSVLYVWQHEVDSPNLEQITAQRDEAIDGTVERLIGLAPEPAQDPAAMRVVLRAVLTDVPYVLSTQLGILPRSDSSGFVTGLLRAGLRAAPPAR
jgi:AcrR family transcriptional regulator